MHHRATKINRIIKNIASNFSDFFKNFYIPKFIGANIAVFRVSDALICRHLSSPI